MSSSLSNLADNLKSCLKFIKIKDKFLKFNCSNWNKSYEIEFDKGLTKRFGNTYEFSNKNINKFCLMLRQDVHPYEYTNSC